VGRAVDGDSVTGVRWRRLAALLAVCLAAVLMPAAHAVGPLPPGATSSPGSVPPTVAPGLNPLPCGNGFCDSRRQYCETIKSDAPEWPSDHACMPLPAACRAVVKASSASCGCFAAGTRCDFCSAVDVRRSGTGFYRTCVGGR
jgi:hypothetical protein